MPSPKSILRQIHLFGLNPAKAYVQGDLGPNGEIRRGGTRGEHSQLHAPVKEEPKPAPKAEAPAVKAEAPAVKAEAKAQPVVATAPAAASPPKVEKPAEAKPEPKQEAPKATGEAVSVEQPKEAAKPAAVVATEPAGSKSS